MEHDEFAALLAREGFETVVTVTREAHGFLDTHVHPFEAKALILQGDIAIQAGGAESTYGPGQIFHLQAHEPHAERYGASGVTYLVGRR